VRDGTNKFNYQPIKVDTSRHHNETSQYNAIRTITLRMYAEKAAMRGRYCDAAKLRSISGLVEFVRGLNIDCNRKDRTKENSPRMGAVRMR
jgi:hypothetical protein